MTKDEFNAALTRCIAIEADPMGGGFPCYPLVGVGGDADAFTAYDNDRHVLLRGIFVEAITQDAIDRAVSVADASSLNDAETGINVVPCVIAPHDAPLSASSEDVLLYYVAIQPGGMLAGMLEFTDYEDAYWDDEEDGQS